MSATAKTMLGVFTAVTVAIAAIAIAENAYDKAHNNIDETIAKKDAIVENISEINSELEEVDNQITELESKKLNITDSDDVSALNTQIELLKQRKELLEWKAKNEQKENEKEAKNIIEGTKNNSTYSGASYMDGESGKLSKGKKLFYSLGGDKSPTTYSAEGYVDSLETRLSSIHPDELQNVIDNLTEINETYDKITQDDTLIDTETYDIAIEKQKQINELIQETQYLQAVRNDLDKEYIDDTDFSSYLGGYTLYQNNLNSLIQKGYSNGLITVDDVKNQFGNYTSNLENELEKQGKSLNDYVTWLNAASAAQIEFLNSSNDNGSATSFKSYTETLNEYKDTLSEIQEKNIDLSKTQFGNIDTNNRNSIVWNDLNLSKYKGELESWNTNKRGNVNWDSLKKNLKNTTSTIYGSVAEFDDIPIAFSPILQTENGAKLLSKDTVNSYINSLIEEATKDGSQWTNDELLKLDARGLNTEGQQIKGLIADIGDTALQTAENMHFVGDTGALGQLKLELTEIIDSMPTVDLTAETENFTKLNTAIKETSTATGLTTESITALKSRFGELSQYNADELFENTSNGVRINREEFEKLEHQQEQITKTNLDTKLNALKEKYNLLTAEMDNCDEKTSATYLSLVQQRNAVVDDINATSELAAQYSGLTSEYQKWIDSQSNGEEGDMYDSIQEGLKKAKELYKSGLVGTNEFQKYVDLLSGKDLSTASVDEIVAVYKELGNTIEGTSYSATDFLAGGSNGVENALKALQELNKDWANEENGKWNLNIPVDEAAEKLGISAEYLEAILKKSTDFGITINYEDTDIAIEKIENLNEVSEKAAKFLKENGLTDIDFNFETDNIEEVDYQLENINGVIDDLRNKDGKLNLDSEEVKNAELVLFSLLKRKSELDQPSIMNIDVSTPANDAEYAVKKIQDLQSAINELSALNTLNEAGFDVDTSEAEEKVKSLAGEINKLPDETKSSLNLDTDEAKTALTNLSNAKISAKAHINQADIDNMKTTISGITPEMTVVAGVDSTKVKDYQKEEKKGKGTVIFDVDKAVSNKNMRLWKVPTRKGKVIYEASGEDNLNGTISGKHRLNGTVNKFGKANASGDWGAKRTETSLMGEIAPEIWVHSDTGKWELVNYPQFRKVKKGDIIFNGSQTKELLSNGSTGAFGDAFIGGTAYVGKNIRKLDGGGKLYGASNNSDSKSSKSKSSSKSSKSSSSKSNKDKKDEKETLDWIEVKIDRIERKIKKLAITAESPYKTLSKRNKALKSEIAQITKEIKVQQDGYDYYMKKAKSVNLSSSLKKKVQNGSININDYSDSTAEKIKEYQQWYEKALSCKDAIADLHEEQASLYEDRFNNVKDDYENQLSRNEHLTNTYETGVDLLDAKGYMASTKYYSAMQNVEKNNISIRKKELSDLEAQFSAAMDSGEIQKYSSAWYSMQAEIDGVKEAIAESEVNLAEFDQTMREIEWERFDYIQERIEQITQEADFLIDLMSNKELYDDKGQLNNDGMATMGLHGQNYNVYMAQADQYAQEILDINKQIAKDPYNTELIARREELLGLQQDSIKAAEDEKQAIVDMVEEGINRELDALKELIDKYTEALDSTKDLYDYQNKVSEKANEISSLQKQLSAYAGDTSEETRAKIQKLQVDLKNAQQDLKETEYDRYISDQKELLDVLYEEYEEILNQRLDDVDALISDMIDQINLNADSINNTLITTANSVGYTMSDNMQKIWDDSTGAVNGVITTYGDKFDAQFTAVNAVLNSISATVASMVANSNAEAAQTIAGTESTTQPAKTTSASDSKSTKNKTNEKTTNTKKTTKEKKIAVGKKINAKGAKIYDKKGDKTGEKQYFANDPIYKVLEIDGNWLKVRYHKSKSGTTGWFKKGDVKAYKTGGLVDYTGLAQVDGTPGKPELMLNSDDTKNFLELRDALRIMASQPLTMGQSYAGYAPTFSGITDISGKLASISNAIGNTNTTIGDIEINIPIEHVENYDDFVRQLQRDATFEKMVRSISTDLLIGKNSLSKYKYKW